MDDTTQSRASDAAATRKRRSSILKSQRPARTPFSELEFNVATPTDTAKSRRVSFSRRTGVAEFVTNEATTTWKNFYEEHNKSLESSGNDSDVNASRQPVEHLGKRIFDQQFEEVEAVDFMGTLNPSLGTNTSLNNINFTDQIASLECTSDFKLTAPRNNFELSALTDHQSKLFGNDFTITGVGELSGRIEVNFSTVQHIGEKDDLDDIERDLGRASNIVCGPSNRHNLSEYIEVDLNMTHVAKNDDCDMSITDTVHSPKVQDVSKNVSVDKKLNASKDWVTDKENIAVNPYVAPCESDNFAVNDEPNQVLVFDGKRLTLETEKPDKEYRKTLLPNASAETPQRKTIVLNMNDDLPNFVSDMSSKSELETHSNTYNDFDPIQHVNRVEIVPKRKTLNDTGNISITQALPTKIISGGGDKRRTLVYGEEENNISITQALPSKIIGGPVERRNTLVYNEEECNISMTQALPSNIIVDPTAKSDSIYDNLGEGNISMTQALPSKIISGPVERRRTMVYNDEECNISMTQALPSNIISAAREESQAIEHKVDEEIDISMTQALPTNIIGGTTDRRRTKLYEQEEGNVSMTQVLPSNIISGAGNKRQTMVYDQEDGNISITQVLPTNILNGQSEKRKTILFDNEIEADVSITQALPSKIINDDVRSLVYEEEEVNISMTEALPANIINNVPKKRLTMVYNDEEANISMTQVLPANIISAVVKRQTLVFDDADISITQALPAKMISGVGEKRQTKIFDQEESNLSITQALPVLVTNEFPNLTERRRTVLYENDSGNISVTQTILANILQSEDEEQIDKCKSVVFDESNGSVVVTKPVNTISEQDVPPISIFEDDAANIPEEPPLNVVSDKEIEEKRRTVVFEDATSNISVTHAVPTNLNESQHLVVSEKSRTVVFEEDTGNISVTQDIAPNVTKEIPVEVIPSATTTESEEIPVEVIPNNTTLKDIDTNKRTVVFENDTGNISVMHPADAQLFVIESKSTVTTATDQVSSESSFISTVDDPEKIRVTNYDESPSEISAPQSVYANIITNYDESPSEISAPQSVYANIITPTRDLSEITTISEISDDKPTVKKVPAVAFLLSGVESHSNVKLEDFVEAKTPTDDGDSDNNMSIVESSPKVNNITQTAQHTCREPEKDIQNTSVSRPIPADLLTIQDNVLTTLVTKRQNLSNEELNLRQDVLLYPSITADVASRSNRNDQVNADTDAHMASPSKMHEIGTSLSAKECSVNLSIQCTENADHAMESKLDDYNLQDKAEEAMDVDRPEDIPPASLDSSERFVLKSSVMDALLDTSDERIQPTDDCLVTSEESLPAKEEIPAQESNDSMFYIIREEDAGIQTEMKSSGDQKPVEKTGDIPAIGETKIPAIEVKELDSPLENKLNELSTEKKLEKSLSTEDDIAYIEPNVETDSHRTARKSFKTANDTKELLDMISDFTDKTRGDIEEDNDSRSPTQPKKEESKETKVEPQRLSFAPNRRQSIAISREDLLNNISMAQAALQKSRIEIEDSAVDDTEDTFAEESPTKTDRLSSEVVKTLHFDDESLSGCSMKSDSSKHSPLRKTAFGETSYMKENKAKVIPTYLKDVTDGIKGLMTDLVKPMADVLPFDTADRCPKKTVSTASTQIQANLTTSSQIDMDELSSAPQSIENDSSFYLQNRTLKNPSDSDKVDTSDSNIVPPSISETCQLQPACITEQTAPGQVLIFDHLNPLNNILLRPIDYGNVHSYNPVKSPITDYPKHSAETLCGSEHSAACQTNMETVTKDSEMPQEKLTTMYRVSTSPIPKVTRHDPSPEKLKEIEIKSPEHIPEIQTSGIRTPDMRNAQINTVIAMKDNKELLNTSSSLTLVDEPILEVSNRRTSKTSEESQKTDQSPVKVLYKVEEQENGAVMEKIDLDSTQTKSKKRNYIPSSLMTAVLPNVDITPKPKTKMQKFSTSPEAKYSTELQRAPKITPERDIETHELQYERIELKPRKNAHKSKTDKNAITVQHLATEYPGDTSNQSILSKKVLQAISDSDPTDIIDYNSLEEVSSFTSSKNLHMINRGESVSTNMSGLKSQTTVASVQSSKSGWHPDMSGISSCMSELDAGVNIVAKIDMLPFMGSHECEWESATADTWRFRLLHGRIRLTVRLAHKHDNAIKSRVRADTPVEDITVDTIQHEKRNPVSCLCVRYACETMRYLVSRARCSPSPAGGGGSGGGGTARGVPALLRRCAAAARVALRWGRAMHDAKLQLAYTLDYEGNLTLKVANIPLRSVWEVSMRLELTSSGSAPWPRAGHVRVTRVLSDVRVLDADVTRALQGTPRDWGHAPRTLWRIFRFLKNKPRDDEMMLAV